MSRHSHRGDEDITAESSRGKLKSGYFYFSYFSLPPLNAHSSDSLILVAADENRSKSDGSEFRNPK